MPLIVKDFDNVSGSATGELVTPDSGCVVADEIGQTAKSKSQDLHSGVKFGSHSASEGVDYVDIEVGIPS